MGDLPWRVEVDGWDCARVVANNGSPVAKIVTDDDYPAEPLAKALCGAVNAAERGGDVGAVLERLAAGRVG